MIRALVVDDEALARRRLRRLLGEHGGVEVVGEAGSGDEAAGLVLRLRPDVVFLDVRMPRASGIETARAIASGLPRAERPLAILTTAHEEHAVEAFELEALDYLLKPVGRERLALALERAARELAARAGGGHDGEGRPDGGAHPTRDAGEHGPRGYLAAHGHGRITTLSHDEVACIEVEGGLVWARTANGRHRLRATIAELEERLPRPPFVRVSRGAIVSLAWIEHLDPSEAGTYLARLRRPLGHEIPVSRRRARELRSLLGW